MRYLLVFGAAFILAACHQWERNVERGGYAFSRYRLAAASGVHIGILQDTAEVDAYTCRAGDWAHFRSDWSLKACFLAVPLTLPHMTIPAGAWVMPREDRLIVAFADDTPCQGYVCGGTGGVKGTHSVFYPDGKLRAFFPPENTQVGPVLCKASLFASVELYQTGGLHRCVAAEDGDIGGAAFRRDETIMLSESGRLL